MKARSNQSLQRQAKEQKLTAERVRSLVRYDPITGHFYWLADRGNRRAGSQVGYIARRGYVNLKIDGTGFRAHRVAWLYMTGAWPEHTIDHRDRNKANNAWINLRHCTQAQNVWNAVRKRRFVGVHRSTSNPDKFLAKIMRNGVTHHLGSFDLVKDAQQAYLKAVNDLSGEFAP